MSTTDSLSYLRGKGPATFADVSRMKHQKKEKLRKPQLSWLTPFPPFLLPPQIPDEILLEILDWLPRGPDYGSFALVCSRMHRVSGEVLLDLQL